MLSDRLEQIGADIDELHAERYELQRECSEDYIPFITDIDRKIACLYALGEMIRVNA
jgi:hypothetical protein